MRFAKLTKTVHRRKYWLIGVILLGSIVLWGRAVSAPVKGRSIPVDLKLKHSTSISTPQLPASAVQSTYFSLDLPAGYRVQDSSTTVPGLLYEQTLIKPSLSGSFIISITVKNMPAGGLSGESSYQWRTGQTNRFKFSNLTVNGAGITVVNDTQSASILAYWPHQGYLASISITAGVDNPSIGDNADELAALQPLLQGWQWQL